MHVAVDVGGTFTDVCILDADSGRVRFEKVETVPANPAAGVLAGFDQAAIALDAVAFFIHGTTLGINALLMRSGAKVAIVTTKGFRDVYALGRTDRDPMYDFKFRKAPVLVPRDRVYEVEERLNYKGEALKDLDPEQARGVARQIKQSGADAVAVCFLHSYANPDHEQIMGRILQEVCPEVAVTLSSDLSREYREYERTSTAVVNAYIHPVVRSYLDHLQEALARRKFQGRFLLVRSGGGAMTAFSAMKEPIHLILSGPAAGVVGAAEYGKAIGVTNLITLDMGGTSLDTALVTDGQPRFNHTQVFQSLPISKPAIDIHTIGAGGGSIAWVDDGGHLQVGPGSAGSFPGPVCYGKGGQDITVTDAALAMGYLDAQGFLGGAMPLQPARTFRCLAALATQMQMEPMDVARGILRISTVKIAGAVREISVEQGHHPRDFSLFAFGGGGPLLATSVARELGIPRVVVPPGSANFSAFGMLMVDVVHDFAQTYVTGMQSLEIGAVNRIHRALWQRAAAALSADDITPDRQRFARMAEMRYRGQEHAVVLSLPDRDLAPEDLSAIVERFNAMHHRHYGHKMDDPVEIVTLRLRATGLLPKPRIPRMPKSGTGEAPAAKARRRVMIHEWPAGMVFPVFERAALAPGHCLNGPAIVEEPTCTTVLHAQDRLVVGDHGELRIAVG